MAKFEQDENRIVIPLSGEWAKANLVSLSPRVAINYTLSGEAVKSQKDYAFE